MHSKTCVADLYQMFEHMKNYKMLMSKVASWLRLKSDSRSFDESLFFCHIFCLIFIDRGCAPATYLIF